MKELLKIQSELKAPKGQTNAFGKYKYRSCEDILEAVKPLLTKNGCTLIISDEMVEVGGRVYVKATVTISANDISTVVTAFARESLIKKGMDESQITGAASSYARKYALNGLFLIDDTKDADSMDNTKQAKSSEPEKPWYNGVDTDMPKIIKALESGKTKKEIITGLRSKFKVSKDVSDLIAAL